MLTTRLRWTLGITACALLAACGGSSNNETPAGSGNASASGSGAQKTYVIGLITKSQMNKVFIPTEKGALAAARDLEEEYGIEIEIRQSSPPQEDANAQANMLSQLATQADGIAISVSNDKTLRNPIDQAVAAGKHVVTFDSDAPESDRMAYFGTDNFQAGREVMQALAEELNFQGRVAVLTGSPNSANLNDRVRGVQSVINEHEGLTLVKVYDNPTEDFQQAVNLMEQAHQAEQIDGWAMVGGWALYVDNALANIPESVTITSLDAAPSQLQYIESGRVAALFGQASYQWGYESVRLLIDRLHRGESPADVVINSPLIKVTADNLDEYRSQLAEWGWN